MLFYTLVLLFSPLNQGTPNTDKCILCPVHGGRNVNNPSTPIEVERKGLQLWCDIAVQQWHNYIKLERILLIFGFLVNMENTIAMYFLFHPLGPFSLKNAALPLNSLFWSPLTAVHRFDASNMAVPGLYFLLKIFLENHFSQNYCVTLLKTMYRSQIKSCCKLQRCNYLFSVLGGICSKGGKL